MIARADMRSLVATLALLTALAGCVSPLAGQVDPASVGDDVVAEAMARVQALLVDVPCEAEVSMDATSENLLPLAVYGTEEHGVANLDAWGDFLTYGVGGKLVVMSVQDPTAPRVVGLLADEEAQGYGDAKFFGDGQYVAAARYDNTIEIFDVSAATWTTPPTGAEPASLVPLGIWEYPPAPPGHLFTNMHMLETHTIEDANYVFLAPNDDTGVWWFRVDVAEGVATFETMEPLGFPLAGGPLGPHDMTVAHDEILDKPILYIANGFEGWQAWDLSDPANPTRLVVLPNLGPGQGYTHTVAAAKVGERRIVATIAEVGFNTLRIFDATDLSRPVPIAEWWVNKADPQTPQHDINIVGGYLTVGHYSYGAFVFDLNALGATPLVGSLDIAPVAHYLPPNVMDEGVAGTGLNTGFANVFDVVAIDGIFYISDFTDAENAITPVAFGCLAPGDGLLSSA